MTIKCATLFYTITTNPAARRSAVDLLLDGAYSSGLLKTEFFIIRKAFQKHVRSSANDKLFLYFYEQWEHFPFTN